MTAFSGVLKGNDFVVRSLNLSQTRTYLLGLAFVAGNVVLPWTFHQFALGGPMFLPIYFFALIAGYKFGYQLGILTAVLSPLANLWLTGMPPVYILPVVVFKGLSLALVASLVANYTKKINILNMVVIVLGSQLLSSLVIYAVTRNLLFAASDVVIGYPGLLLQVFGGYYLLKSLRKVI